MDELTDGDEGCSEVEVEVDDVGVLVGAPAKLAVAVHPGVGALYYPPFADLDRGWDAFAGDLTVQAQGVEELSGHTTVVAGVQVHGGVFGQMSELREGLLEGWCEQGRVMAVGPCGDDPQRDDVAVGG